jgi:hypothetical protein
MATMPRRRADDHDGADGDDIRATIEAHAPRARQEFRAGLVVLAVFVVGLAVIFSVGTPY